MTLNSIQYIYIYIYIYMYMPPFFFIQNMSLCTIICTALLPHAWRHVALSVLNTTHRWTSFMSPCFLQDNVHCTGTIIQCVHLHIQTFQKFSLLHANVLCAYSTILYCFMHFKFFRFKLKVSKMFAWLKVKIYLIFNQNINFNPCHT